MSQIVTIPERKAIEAARRQQAVADLAVILRDYARTRGGRFLLYGSAARNTMRHDSDVDVIVDFPPETRSDAWDFVEAECALRRLPVDVTYADWCGEAFLAHIAPIVLT